MSDELVITAALCGAETTREHNPAVPYTPAELAAEARRCADAGAHMVHVHARLDDGTPTQSSERYRASVAAIREAAPELIVQVSTGGAVGMEVDERLGSLAAVTDGAEMATCTCGSVNFGSGIFANAAPDMLRIARAILEAGIRPELEIFDLGHLDNARWLAGKAPLDGPQHHDLVLGVPGGLAGEPRNVVLLAERLPAGATWSAAGIGRTHRAVVAAALATGGHVRVGLEDQIELRPGELAASNAALVEQVVEIAALAGRTPATPERARELLGLSMAASPA